MHIKACRAGGVIYLDRVSKGPGQRRSVLVAAPTQGVSCGDRQLSSARPQRIANMATELTGTARPTPPISPGRRRWANLAQVDLLLVASVAIWVGVVILMIVG